MLDDGIDRSKYKNLGCMNWWHSEGEDAPPEAQKCFDAGHSHIAENIGNCWTKYYCDICKIYYDVDSSD